MSKEALEVRTVEPAAATDPAGKPMTLVVRAALFSAVLVAVFLAMSGLYGLLILAKTGRPPQGAEDLHVAANAAANLLVVAGSWTRRGQIHERFTWLLGRILWAHGFLALVVVLTHSPYSNVVMISAAVMSALLGLAVIAASHRISRPSVALVGPLDELGDQISAYAEPITNPRTDLRHYDLILTTFADDIPSDWAKALSRALLAGKRVRHASEYLEEARGLVLPEHFDVELVDGRRLAAYEAAKRVLDVLITLVGLPIALPILAISALAIRVTMGAPVIFRQERVGRGGKVFRMLKLRTMITPADTELESITTQQADPRITALGRFLRRLHIDELPQIWHVLTGQMSLVGPRPEWSLLAEDYVRAAPVYAFRHLVRPGITGWAQVRAGYAADLRETRLKLAFDLYYVKNFSFALDLQILLRTAWIMLTGYGWR